MPGLPLPHPSPTGDPWHPPVDAVATAWMLAILFVPAMYVCFALGAERIATWWELRRVKRP